MVYEILGLSLGSVNAGAFLVLRYLFTILDDNPSLSTAKCLDMKVSYTMVKTTKILSVSCGTLDKANNISQTSLEPIIERNTFCRPSVMD